MDTMTLKARLLMALLMSSATFCAVAEEPSNYVFSWPFVTFEGEVPRGGTTSGPPVEILSETTEAFQRLQADGLDKFERDRRAILAMAGTYRVSFDFMEVVGYAPGFEPAAPYQSWGTEHVYVVDDSGETVSLQHVLIMSIVGEDGNVMGPFVTKHWRQDWTWQDPEVHVYAGQGTWRRESRSKEERAGHWSQTVWQVDDSPRYAAWGQWEHSDERSVWRSGETWRPLPRREFSVRDDYDVLIATNDHMILPTGWVQEEHNVKAVLAGPGEVERNLAREFGIARYERLVDFDTAPGDEYWKATGEFWGEVRAYWDRAMAQDDSITLKPDVEGRPLFSPLFERAQAIADGENFSNADNRRYITETIDSYRADLDEASSARY